jgi:hypothetical protein
MQIYFCRYYVIKHTYVAWVQSAILKGWKSGLLVNFGQFPCSRIRIRIQESKSMRILADLDPDPHLKHCSWLVFHIRIHIIIFDYAIKGGTVNCSFCLQYHPYSFFQVLHVVGHRERYLRTSVQAASQQMICNTQSKARETRAVIRTNCCSTASVLQTE